MGQSVLTWWGGGCELEARGGVCLLRPKRPHKQTTGMGQQVGRVGEVTSTGLQPPQPHATQPQPGKGNRGSGAGRRPRGEPGSSSTGTPPGRAASANAPDPGINIFTQHSGKKNDEGSKDAV